MERKDVRRDKGGRSEELSVGCDQLLLVAPPAASLQLGAAR